jgi:hypothetical protein
MRPLAGAGEDVCGGVSPDPNAAEVVPLLVPSASVENGAWPGPYEQLGAKGVVLAWGCISRAVTEQHLLHELREQWEAQGVDWKSQALENLRRLGQEPTGVLFRDDGEVWLVSFMHQDGLGPSRLLLRDYLEQIFPKGYRVAMPERNRGFAFAVDLDSVDADTVENLIHNSYSKGEHPLSPGIFAPDDLLSATPSSTT